MVEEGIPSEGVESLEAEKLEDLEVLLDSTTIDSPNVKRRVRFADCSNETGADCGADDSRSRGYRHKNEKEEVEGPSQNVATQQEEFSLTEQQHRSSKDVAHNITPSIVTGDGGAAVVRRCNSLPEGKVRLSGVQKLLLAQASRSPSANIIKKEFRYASLKKVDRESCRRSYVPLISNKNLILGPDLYQSLLAHSKRSPSANVIKKEYRYASLKTVDHEACRRRSEPLISTKDLLLDPDVYELLLAHSRRSPSANVIKKEFRYACLRKVNNNNSSSSRTATSNRKYDYYDDASSISTMVSSNNFLGGNNSFDDDEIGGEYDDEHGHGGRFYVYDWLMDLEPMMPLPDLFPYYERTAYSDGGRRMSGSTLQSENLVSLSAPSSVVSGCSCDDKGATSC